MIGVPLWFVVVVVGVLAIIFATLLQRDRERDRFVQSYVELLNKHRDEESGSANRLLDQLLAANRTMVQELCRLAAVTQPADDLPCPHCGFPESIKDERLVCANCGLRAYVPDHARGWTCGRCGKSNEAP